MRRRPMIAPPLALSLLPILTGCHLGRVPSPALSMAAVALSAGAWIHLLIAWSEIAEGLSIAPGPDRV
jgi:hypothetical protein